MAGCDGPAPGASSTLKSMSAIKIFSTVPAGWVQIGSARDQGSNSSIIGRDPVFEKVWATSMSPADVVAFYKTKFPQYRFTEEGGSLPPEQVLDGQDGWAGIAVYITPGPPTLRQNFKVSLKHSPPADNTSVLVFATGTPPNQANTPTG